MKTYFNKFTKSCLAIFFLLLATVMISGSAQAMDFYYSQYDISTEFLQTGEANVLAYDVDMNLSELTGAINGTPYFINKIQNPDDLNLTYDNKITFRSLDSDVYMLIDNPKVNREITMYWQDSGFAKYRNITLEEQGTYIFKFSPSVSSGEEWTNVWLDFKNETGTQTLYTINTRGFEPNESVVTAMSFSSSIANFIINVWKLCYYIILVVLVVGILFGIVGLGFKAVEWAERFAELRKKYIYDREEIKGSRRNK